MIIGIDPGINGAMACLGADHTLDIFDVPKIGKEPDYVTWASVWGANLPFAKHVWIEKVGAMPGQGVTSMFNFGERYGFVIGLVASANVPFSFVRPQAWKAAAGITNNAEKGASRLRAKQIFPGADWFDRAKDDGRAEAALIAYVGMIRAKE